MNFCQRIYFLKPSQNNVTICSRTRDSTFAYAADICEDTPSILENVASSLDYMADGYDGQIQSLKLRN